MIPRTALGTALVGILACAWLACASNEEKRDAHLERAETYLATGQTREAMVELRSALRFDPNSAETNFRIAKLLQSQQALADAIFFLGETLRLDPERSDAALELAGLLMFDDQARALELVDGVLAKDPASVQAYITRSRIEAARSDVAASLAAAKTAVELAPNDPAAHQQMGKVHAMRIQEARMRKQEVDDAFFQAAIASFGRAVELSVPGLAWMGKLEQARVFGSWPGHGDQAEQAYRDGLEAAKQSGISEALLTSIGQSLSYARETKRRGLLRTSLSMLVESEPGNLLAWDELAGVEEESGGSADAVLARMLEALPDSPLAHAVYARELVERDRTDDAAKHLEAQAERGIDPPTLLATLVNLLHSKQRDDEAARVLERLEREHPDHPRTILARAQTAAEQGRIADAAADLRELVGRAEDPVALQLLAWSESRLGNPKAALAAADRAIQTTPRGVVPADALRLKAQLQAGAGDCNGSLASFRALAGSGTKLAVAEQVLKVHCLYEVGRRDMASKALALLLKKDPPPIQAVLEYDGQEGKANPQRARELLEKALETHPAHPALVNRLARMELDAGRPDRALARLNEAIESGRATPQILLQRARVFAVQGDLRRGQQDALQAFEAQPNLEGASALVAALYRAQGQSKEAIASFEEALAAGALRPSGRFLLAQLYLTTGNPARARELLEALVADRADIAVAKNDLAYLLADEGVDLDRALRLAEEASQALGELPAVADTLGFVYLKKALHEPALQQFQRAVILAKGRDADQSVYHYHMGLALQALGRNGEAAAAFEQALALDGDFEDARQALDGLRAEGGAEPAAGGA